MSEVFIYDNEEARLMPGTDWAAAVSHARTYDKITPGLQRIARLGTALAGAIHGKVGATIDMNEFAEAAIPPMMGAERSQFQQGFRQGELVLLVSDREGARV